MTEWFYCDAQVRVIGSRPMQYRECGTWSVESECGFEFVQTECGEVVKKLNCPECGGDSLWEMSRCEYLDHGAQCAAPADHGHTMCRAHLAWDEDWLADRAEAMAKDPTSHPSPF